MTPGVCAPQERPQPTVQEKIARGGVFFRADAPWALRNHEDTYLPVYLEIINGVEKTGHSAARQLSQYLTRDAIKLEGVDFYVKPAGAGHAFSDEALRLGASKDFSFDARTDNQPLAIPERMKKTLEIPLAVIQSYLEHHYVGGPHDVIDIEVAFHATG